MRCHYCDRPADVAVESDAVVVGLCASHLRERVESLAGDAALAAFDEILDREGP